MARYKPGFESKEKIYNTAKELFYEKGFLGTTLAEISKRSETNKAMVSYYFKGKNQLALDIYNEHVKAVRDITKEETDKIDPNLGVAMRTAIEFRVQNYICLANPQLDRFYSEMATTDILLENKSITVDYISEMNKEYNLGFNDDEVLAISVANLGSLHSLHTASTTGVLPMEGQKLAEAEIRMLFRIFGFDKKFIEDIIKRSGEMMNQIGLTVCENFEVKANLD